MDRASATAITDLVAIPIDRRQIAGHVNVLISRYRSNETQCSCIEERRGKRLVLLIPMSFVDSKAYSSQNVPETERMSDCCG